MRQNEMKSIHSKMSENRHLVYISIFPLKDIYKRNIKMNIKK